MIFTLSREACVHHTYRIEALKRAMNGETFQG